MARRSRRSRRSADFSESVYPQWFSAFLADRAVRKPSPHTAKTYRQDFVAIAELLAADRPQMAQLTPADITKDAMRAAFAAYAELREPATIRRSCPRRATDRPMLPAQLPWQSPFNSV